MSNYGGNYYFTSPVWLHSLVADAREVSEDSVERLLMVLLIELEFRLDRVCSLHEILKIGPVMNRIKQSFEIIQKI